MTEITITKRVWKIKNSLVIVIPRDVAETLNIEPNDILELKIIRVIKRSRRGD